MDLRVQPSSNLHGTFITPPNKSHYFRALILGSLADGLSKLYNLQPTKDWGKGVKALAMLGSTIRFEEDHLEIQGNGGHIEQPRDILDCGNSGILFRFLMGVAAGCEGYTVITGDESLKTLRPAQEILKGLQELGCTAISLEGNGHAPVLVKGKIKGGTARVEGSDSQTVSGLLIAAALADAPSEIFVQHPGEKPWIEVTLSWLRRVGITVENIGNTYEHYRVAGKEKIRPFNFTVPNDWSAALYPIVAALITPGSQITITGLDPNDVQGDKKAVAVLQEMGADIEISKDRVVARSSRLQGREIDCNDFIDQFLILAIAGAYATGTTRLYNAAVCRHKESDRILAMYEGLKSMGATVEELPDGLRIEGGKALQGAQIQGVQDHRVIMSFAVAGLLASGETRISDAEMIEKSFGDFIPQMERAGAHMELLPHEKKL